MARVKNPILFSTHFKVDQSAISGAGLIDPFLNVDTQLFIDPTLLEKSANLIIRTEALDAFHSHFSKFVRLLVISDRQGDAAWIGAQRLLDLREPPENGLGYGGSGRSGSSRPGEIRDAIVRTSKEIVDLGSKDPDMICLMGFFEEGVGSDTISDFTTRVIADQLAALTEIFCLEQRIPIRKSSPERSFSLPHFFDQKGRERSTVLVPRDIVRELPIARDWSDIEAASLANRQIRDRVSFLLAGIAKPTVSDRKAALRRAAMESAELFGAFLDSVKDYAAHYDPNKDALGYYKLKEILAQDKAAFKAAASYDLAGGIVSIVAMVHDTIAMFKHHVENGNLWEALWEAGTPKENVQLS